MAKVDVTSEILKHTDEEVIEFLYEKMKGIKLDFNGAFNQGDPTLVYSAYGDVELVTDVLRKLNRRNEEKAL